MKFWPQPVNLHPIFCKCALVSSLFLFGAERIFLAALDAVGLRPATMLSLLLLSAQEETYVSNEIFHHLFTENLLPEVQAQCQNCFTKGMCACKNHKHFKVFASFCSKLALKTCAAIILKHCVIASFENNNSVVKHCILKKLVIGAKLVSSMLDVCASTLNV